jgi:hypothetical protein
MVAMKVATMAILMVALTVEQWVVVKVELWAGL